MIIMAKGIEKRLLASQEFNSFVVDSLMVKGFDARFKIYAEMFERRNLTERVSTEHRPLGTSLPKYMCNRLMKAAHNAVKTDDKRFSTYTPFQEVFDWIMQEETSIFFIYDDAYYRDDHAYMIQEYRMRPPINADQRLKDGDVNRLVNRLNLVGVFNAIKQGYSYGLLRRFAYYGPSKDKIELFVEDNSNSLSLPMYWGWRSDT